MTYSPCTDATLNKHRREHPDENALVYAERPYGLPPVIDGGVFVSENAPRREYHIPLLSTPQGWP